MGISISINAGADAASSSVHASGSVQHVITPSERTAFNIEDASLKSAVGTYWGKKPNDAYVCSPTPWSDLYKTYGWPQVQTLLSVQSARVVGVTSEPTIVATQQFENISNIKGTFDCAVSQDVAVTTESSWSNTSSVEIGQSISYGVTFLGAGAQGETSMSFSESWEQGGSESETVTIGMTSGVGVELLPGQSVNAELSASRGVLTVEIVYQLSLSGNCAVNYSDKYKGHHFYTFDINTVMAAAGIPIVITTTETMKVGFYANSKITLLDPSGAGVGSAVPGGVAGA